jgi:hypothetical protein
MPSLSRFRRLAVLCLALSLFATPGTWAARPAARTPEPAKLLGQAWSLLTVLWTKEGCHIDPNGRCVTSPPAVTPLAADTGCNIDPNGRCHS